VNDRPLVAVLDYGIGNLASAQKALVHEGAEARLTADHGLIREAAAVVLPGVGAFGACMAALRRADLEDVAVEAAAGGRPFFGICVGMQMLFEASEETPGVAGLGVIAGTIAWIPPGV
jgi:glutamine amidotransferase